MTAPASLLPPSVEALNRLLRERGVRDDAIPRALGLSFLAHAVAVVALALLVGRPGRPGDFGATTSVGILPVHQILGGAPPGPAPKPLVAPAPRPVEKPAPPPAEKPEPVAEPQPEPEAAPEDLIREARPVPRPKPRRTAVPAAPVARTSAPPAKGTTTATAAGGGTLAATRGGPGSPSGVLAGDPDGGLTTLIFTDQWYVQRVQDLVYANWGNPFAGQPGPATATAVVVHFRIFRDGSVGDVAIATSSGDAAWDRAGLRAAENARLPPIPPAYSGASLSVFYRFEYDPAQVRR